MLDSNQYIDGVHSAMQYTALHAASDFGHVEVVRLLIERGFDKFIDMLDGRWGQTALHYAAQNGRKDVVGEDWEGAGRGGGLGRLWLTNELLTRPNV